MSERQSVLIKKVTPLLNPGEVARHVFEARTGENPWIAALPKLPRYYVATDDAIVVISTGAGLRAKAVIGRLSRTTRLGEPQFSRWGYLFWQLLLSRWIRVNNERLWVAMEDVDVVRAIDAEVERTSRRTSA